MVWEFMLSREEMVASSSNQSLTANSLRTGKITAKNTKPNAQHAGLIATTCGFTGDPNCLPGHFANKNREYTFYTLSWRAYGANGVRMHATADRAPAAELFILGECIAPTHERAAEVMRTAKQYLLHHGYEGRLSTGGNLAFPFTPPEVSVGAAYRFNVYHLMCCDDLEAMFPLEMETLG
jgi:hypothetical protein